MDYIERLKRIREAIPRGSWDLMNFTGNSESEVMIAQTVYAAINNLNGQPKEPYSIRNISDGYGNQKAYEWLIRDGYFREETREEKTVIFITDKLLEKLEGYLQQNGKLQSS